MTKKDYILIAQAITEARDSLLCAPGVSPEEIKNNLDFVAGILAVKLERDNERFDRVRFLTACGITGE